VDERGGEFGEQLTVGRFEVSAQLGDALGDPGARALDEIPAAGGARHQDRAAVVRGGRAPHQAALLGEVEEVWRAPIAPGRRVVLTP
jgi:hypothetical protein